MFDFYICTVSLYFSVSSNGEVPKNGDFWDIHNRKPFMLTPFIGSFNIIMVLDFPVYLLSSTIVSVVYSFGTRIMHPEIMWSIILVLVSQNQWGRYKNGESIMGLPHYEEYSPENLQQRGSDLVQ